MSQICKDYLDKIGFIIQALGVDEMEFKFYDSTGGKIQLSVDNVSQYIGIAAGVSWSVDNTYSLIITTPKFIGYQLGALRRSDGGLALYRANRADGDQFIFEKLDVFTNYIDEMHIYETGDEEFFFDKADLDTLSIPVAKTKASGKNH
jgi:hypothetical protein